MLRPFPAMRTRFLRPQQVARYRESLEQIVFGRLQHLLQFAVDGAGVQPCVPFGSRVPRTRSKSLTTLRIALIIYLLERCFDHATLCGLRATRAPAILENRSDEIT